MSKKFCFDCEKELTKKNTASYEGFDEGNYNMSKVYSAGQMPKEWFTKCDDCFDADIDSYLENLYN